MDDGYKNGSAGSVLIPPSPVLSGTTMTLLDGEGENMPSPPFNAIAKPRNVQPRANLDNFEVVRVTDVTDDVVTMDRAQEGTAAKTIAAGWDFYAGVTARTLNELASGQDKSFTQSFSSSTSVTVTHNLGKKPSVTVNDSAGDECKGEVHHDSVNQLVVSFSAPFSGIVICN